MGEGGPFSALCVIVNVSPARKVLFQLRPPGLSSKVRLRRDKDAPGGTPTPAQLVGDKSCASLHLSPDLVHKSCCDSTENSAGCSRVLGRSLARS